MIDKGGSRHKYLYMARVLGFLIRYFSNYFTLHRSDLAARAAPLDPRLIVVYMRDTRKKKHTQRILNLLIHGVKIYEIDLLQRHTSLIKT